MIADQVPLSAISNLSTVVTNCCKTLAQVKTVAGADYILK